MGDHRHVLMVVFFSSNGNEGSSIDDELPFFISLDASALASEKADASGQRALLKVDFDREYQLWQLSVARGLEKAGKKDAAARWRAAAKKK